MKKTSKTILITGASSGFGRDMAETLAADAHKVYGGVRDLAGRNSAAAEALRGKGVEVLELDVTSDAEVEDGIKSLLARSGRKLDVLAVRRVQSLPMTPTGKISKAELKKITSTRDGEDQTP